MDYARRGRMQWSCEVWKSKRMNDRESGLAKAAVSKRCTLPILLSQFGCSF